MVQNTITKKQVKSALAKISKGFQGTKDPTQVYDQSYAEAIKRIDDQPSARSELARKALSWITYAARQLTTGELCHALAVEPDTEELDRDNIPDVDDIISVCAGLVVVDEASNVVRLVHYTTQEYLERVRGEWIPNAELEIASACLTYLSFPTFKSGWRDTSEVFEDRIEQHELLPYVAEFWAQHTYTLQEKLSETALAFLQDVNLVSSSHQPKWAADLRKGIYLGNVTGLHLTAQFGLLYFSERLLSRSENTSNLADAKDYDGRSPLSWAAEYGQQAIVEMLLERKDVDANAMDDFGLTPLAWASSRGHEEIVKLLMEQKNVDADPKDRDGWTPLSWAAYTGHEGVVRLLMERNEVQVNWKSVSGRTPLSLAAARGREATVRVLLEREDVDVNAKNSRDQTPLWLSAQRGYEGAVRLLLEREDVTMDCDNLYGWSPLDVAEMWGYEAVVELLKPRRPLKVLDCCLEPAIRSRNNPARP